MRTKCWETTQNAHIGLKWSDWRMMGFSIQQPQFAYVTVIIPPCPAPNPRKMRPSATWGRRKMGSWPIFPLSLSPPQFEIWNLVHFSQVCPPGSQFLQRQHRSALTQLHLAFSDLNQFWHFDRKLLSIFFFFKEPPLPSFYPVLPLTRGLDLFLQRLFLKLLSPANCMWILKYPKLLFSSRSHWEKASLQRAFGPGCGWSWALTELQTKRDEEASPASFLLSSLHLFNYITVSGM